MPKDYIKLQEIEELRQAIKIKQVNEELLETLASNVLWIVRYSHKYGIPLRESDRIKSILEKAQNLLSQIYPEETSPDFEHSKYHPKDEHYQLIRIFILPIGSKRVSPAVSAFFPNALQPAPILSRPAKPAPRVSSAARRIWSSSYSPDSCSQIADPL